MVDIINSTQTTTPSSVAVQSTNRFNVNVFTSSSLFCVVIFFLALFRLQGRNIDLAHWDTISGRVVNATLLCQNGVTFCTVFTIEDSLDADNGKNEMLLIILLLSTS